MISPLYLALLFPYFTLFLSTSVLASQDKSSRVRTKSSLWVVFLVRSLGRASGDQLFVVYKKPAEKKEVEVIQEHFDRKVWLATPTDAR